MLPGDLGSLAGQVSGAGIQRDNVREEHTLHIKSYAGTEQA
jgi:hypothetical protein